MADIPLKSFTLPGLPDKYTTPVVDNTLAVAGAAADAKKTGDEIGAIKNDLSEMSTATAEDVGKALKAKTVTNGKVSEWEFGEAGGDEEVIADLQNVTDLVVKSDYAYSGNVVDATGVTASELGNITTDIFFSLSDGVYYTNPFTTNTGKNMIIRPYDKDGNLIAMTRNGSAEQSIELHNNFLWKVTVDGLSVNAKGYPNQSAFETDSATFNRTYIIASIPAKWKLSGSGYGAHGTIDRGLTKDTYDMSFVSYVAPEKVYDYADALDEHIAEIVGDVTSDLRSDVTEISENAGDISAMVGKTAEIYFVYSGNIVDTTGKTAPGSNLDNSIHFNLGNGIYYCNPFTTTTEKKITIYPKNKNGQDIYITKTNGYRVNVIEMYAGLLWKVVINGLRFSAICYSSIADMDADNRQSSYTVEGILDVLPDYWIFGGSGYTAGEAIERGFTQSEYNTSYIAYAEPEKTYKYASELDKHIETFTDGLQSELLVPSDNMLDYNQILWYPNSGYYYFKRGYYIAVEAGTIIETNCAQGYMYFYDSAYTQIGRIGFVESYTAIEVPTDAVWMTMIMNVSKTHEGDPVMIWKARSEKSAKYERPIYRPNVGLRPDYLDGGIYDYAVPKDLTQGVMRMSRFAAFRASNEMRSAYRIGTFNVYVNTVGTGYAVMREMILDYGIDFLGMQECRQLASVIKSAMYPFQFPYASADTVTGQVANSIISTPVISRFEVVSTNAYLYNEDYNQYRCVCVKMNMPQNKHYPRVPTLSVYNYHGSLNHSARLVEIQTMLDIIANDTSDFIIIMGDTNSEVDSTGHRQSWDAWENAGFRAVHHGESPTWPNPVGSRYSSIDNIFVSEHINVLNYDIIMADKYPINESGQGGRPLSDHDLVFADLQFDFDAVLKDTWEEPPTVTV